MPLSLFLITNASGFHNNRTTAFATAVVQLFKPVKPRSIQLNYTIQGLSGVFSAGGLQTAERKKSRRKSLKRFAYVTFPSLPRQRLFFREAVKCRCKTSRLPSIPQNLFSERSRRKPRYVSGRRDQKDAPPEGSGGLKKYRAGQRMLFKEVGEDARKESIRSNRLQRVSTGTSRRDKIKDPRPITNLKFQPREDFFQNPPKED